MDTNFNNDQNNNQNEVIQNNIEENVTEQVKEKQEDLAVDNVKQIGSEDNPNAENETNSSTRKKDLIRSILLSLVIGYFGLSMVYGNLSEFNSYFTNDYDKINNFFIYSIAGISELIGTVLLLIIIWVLYFTKPAREKIKNKMSSKTRKIIRIVYFLFLLSAIFYFCYRLWEIHLFFHPTENNSIIENVNNNKKLSLKQIFDTIPLNNYDSFIYNDKIYFSELTSKWNSKNDTLDYYNKFYQMDLDGKNIKVISEDERLRLAYFDFIYKNEAYFTGRYYGCYGKINLNTGKIEILHKDSSDNHLSDYVINDNYAYFLKHGGVYDKSFVLFQKKDLKTDKIVLEVKINKDINRLNRYIDYNNGDIYYVISDIKKDAYIYKNNDVIFHFDDKVYNNANLKILAVNENSLYFSNNKIIYKIDILNNAIEKTFDNTFTNIKRIKNDDGLNYYYDNKKIYYLDTDNDEFIEVLDNIEIQPEKIHEIGNSIVFIDKLYTSMRNYSKVTFYSKETHDVKIYDNVRNYSVEGNYIYLVLAENDDYVVKKINLN